MADKLTVKVSKFLDESHKADIKGPEDADSSTPNEFTDSEVRAHNARSHAKADSH